MSPRLERFLKYVAAHPDYDPPALDDAADLLRDMSDERLSLICGEPPGAPVCLNRGMESLRYSCLLRYQIETELDDLELSLPDTSPALLAEVGIK